MGVGCGGRRSRFVLFHPSFKKIMSMQSMSAVPMGLRLELFVSLTPR